MIGLNSVLFTYRNITSKYTFGKIVISHHMVVKCDIFRTKMSFLRPMEPKLIKK